MSLSGILAFILASGFALAWRGAGRPGPWSKLTVLAAVASLVGGPFSRHFLVLWFWLGLTSPQREKSGFQLLGELMVVLGLVGPGAFPGRELMVLLGLFLAAGKDPFKDPWTDFHAILVPGVLTAAFLPMTPAFGGGLMFLSVLSTLRGSNPGFFGTAILAALVSRPPAIALLFLASAGLLARGRAGRILSGLFMAAGLAAGFPDHPHKTLWLLGGLGWGISAARGSSKQVRADSFSLGVCAISGILGAALSWSSLVEGLWGAALPGACGLAILGPLALSLWPRGIPSWVPRRRSISLPKTMPRFGFIAEAEMKLFAERAEKIGLRLSDSAFTVQFIFLSILLAAVCL